MVERAGGARFEFQATTLVGVSRGAGQYLDGDLAGEGGPRVARSIDFAHPAGAERADDFVGAESSAGSECHGDEGAIIRRDVIDILA